MQLILLNFKLELGRILERVIEVLRAAGLPTQEVIVSGGLLSTHLGFCWSIVLDFSF